MTVKVIAEFGSNPAAYGWDFALFCNLAKWAGATDVKIQLWRAGHFTEAERVAKRPLEFPRDRLSEFVTVAHERDLGAGASVFDTEAVELAAQGCDWLKLAAREFENMALKDAAWNAAWKAGKGLYISRPALSRSLRGPGLITTPMFTISEYPAPAGRILLGLARVAWWTGWHNYRWGWSSHSAPEWLGLDCCLAVALGASVIEKHFALSRIDIEAAHSLTPEEFSKMARATR